MYINSENLKYIRGKSAKQVFDDVCSLTEYYNDRYKHFLYNNINISVIPNIGELIKKQIIFEVYYAMYLSDSKPQTIAYFMKKYEGKENDVLSSDPDYAKMKAIYKKARQYADEMAQHYHHDQSIGRYVKLQKGIYCFRGHGISLLDYLYLLRQKNNYNIEYLMNNLMYGKVSHIKKMNNNIFKERFAVGIEELYSEMANTDYSKYGCGNGNYFYKSVDYYQFEKYCNIELCYLATYAATQKKLKNMDDLYYLRERIYMPIANYLCQVQNVLIWFGKDVLTEYLKDNVDIEQIIDILQTVNKYIFLCKHILMKQYFADLLKTVPLPLCGEYMQRQSARNENFLGITSLNSLMCEETEEFFRNYFGEGQHINPKDYEKIAIRYFRAMYKTE